MACGEQHSAIERDLAFVDFLSLLCLLIAAVVSALVHHVASHVAFAFHFHLALGLFPSALFDKIE